MTDLPRCKQFAAAAAAAVAELADRMPDAERAALNRHLETGGRVSLALSVNGAGHSEIQLDVIETDGTPHRFLSVEAHQLRLV